MHTKLIMAIFYLCLGFITFGQDTFSVHFSFNCANIDVKEKNRIDELIFKDKLIYGQKLIVLGYTDYVGSDKYNDSLSLLRARHVADYLIEMGFDKNDISRCVGKGKIQRDVIENDGNAEDRLVRIIIDNLKSVKPSSSTNILSYSHEVYSDLNNLKLNDVLPLDHVLFELSSDKITSESFSELGILLSFLKKNPTIAIQIEGHICCGGWTSGHNSDISVTEMSYKRAYAVYEFMLINGIDKKRLTCKGLGSTDPYVKPERTVADEILNRRVGIRVIAK